MVLNLQPLKFISGEFFVIGTFYVEKNIRTQKYIGTQFFGRLLISNKETAARVPTLYEYSIYFYGPVALSPALAPDAGPQLSPEKKNAGETRRDIIYADLIS